MATKAEVQGNTCWNCEGPGIPYSGSRWICPKCDVVWFPIPVKASPPNDMVVYRGVPLKAVDFSDPMAPSSPA